LKNKITVFSLLVILAILLVTRSCQKINDSYIEKFLGNWVFNVQITAKHGCPGSGPLFRDTSYSVTYDGVINRGEGDKEIIIFYTESLYTIESVGKDGIIINTSTDNKVGSSGEFEGDNKLTMSLWQNTSGRCYSVGITGERIYDLPALNKLPEVQTDSAKAIVFKGATLNGTVIANHLPTNAYFEYGTSAKYDHSVTLTSDFPIIGGTGTKNVSYSVSGLEPGTTYHFRIKADNSLGTTFGEDLTFATVTSSDPVTDIDGNVYNTIPIGNQIWMVENLKTTKYYDGTLIPHVTDNASWINLTTAGFCWYNDNETLYKSTYGALFNWNAVNSGKLCPAGWHMPEYKDWYDLKNYLLSGLSGLKETGTSHWTSPNKNATNVTGFTALPGGRRNIDGTFADISIVGYWWSATEKTLSDSWVLFLTYDGTGVLDFDKKALGFSVRCLKD
jgi:uncharacterized protein (TIGR02145 family)